MKKYLNFGKRALALLLVLLSLLPMAMLSALADEAEEPAITECAEPVEWADALA